MQRSGWGDGSGILQIGMEPRHLLALMEEKSLKNVFRMMPFEMNGALHIMNADTNQIIASTKEEMVGLDMDAEMEKYKARKHTLFGSHHMFHGQQYCIYTERYRSYILIRSYLSRYSLQKILDSLLLFICYMVLIAFGVIGILRWYVNKKLVRNLLLINESLKRNENGNLETITLKTGIKEFDEVLFYINHMLDNIRSSWERMDYVMEKGNISIGILEQNRFYKKNFVNHCMLDILEISEEEIQEGEELIALVQEKLRQAKEQPVSGEEQVYAFRGNSYVKYLRIEQEQNEQSLFYYVTDVSGLWGEIRQLRTKSETDPLVNLYNRRGLSEKVLELFARPEQLGCAMIVMVDADRLKVINDAYGHTAGDEYLKQIAGILQDTFSDRAVCARIGGDEFLCLLYGRSSFDQLEALLDRLKSRRSEPFVLEGQPELPHSIQFSVGVSYYPQDGEDFELLMHLADEKMYQEKKERKLRRTLEGQEFTE